MFASIPPTPLSLRQSTFFSFRYVKVSSDYSTHEANPKSIRCFSFASNQWAVGCARYRVKQECLVLIRRGNPTIKWGICWRKFLSTRHCRSRLEDLCDRFMRLIFDRWLWGAYCLFDTIIFGLSKKREKATHLDWVRRERWDKFTAQRLSNFFSFLLFLESTDGETKKGILGKKFFFFCFKTLSLLGTIFTFF